MYVMKRLYMGIYMDTYCNIYKYPEAGNINLHGVQPM